MEIEMLPNQISAYKVEFHKNYLKEWLNENPQIKYDLEEIWKIREQCIEDLSRKWDDDTKKDNKTTDTKMNGITYIENFIDNPAILFDLLVTAVKWDERMSARKTASFGKAYNYSQIEYPYQDFLPELETIINKLEPVIGFQPNNCLINYYVDGKSRMGYHSDQTDILETGTGIAIVSVGEKRILKFRNIENPEQFLTYELTAGSLVYMTQEVQTIWQHSIPKSNTENGRISLTFREML